VCRCPGGPDSDAGSNKAGRSGAPAARASAYSIRGRGHSDAKPRRAALSASKAVSLPSLPMSRGRKPPSVSKMDSVEIVLQSHMLNNVYSISTETFIHDI